MFHNSSAEQSDSGIIIIIDNFCIALLSGVPKLTARVCLILILPVVKFYESLTRGILITVIVCTKRWSFSRQVKWFPKRADAVPHNDESVVKFLLALPWWAPLHSYEYVWLSALTDVSNGMHPNSSQLFLQFKMLTGLQQTALRNNRHADPSFWFVFRFCLISILFAAKWYGGLYEQQLFKVWDLLERWARHFFFRKRRFLKRPFDVQLQR